MSSSNELISLNKDKINFAALVWSYCSIFNFNISIHVNSDNYRFDFFFTIWGRHAVFLIIFKKDNINSIRIVRLFVQIIIINYILNSFILARTYFLNETKKGRSAEINYTTRSSSGIMDFIKLQTKLETMVKPYILSSNKTINDYASGQMLMQGMWNINMVLFLVYTYFLGKDLCFKRKIKRFFIKRAQVQIWSVFIFNWSIFEGQFFIT